MTAVSIPVIPAKAGIPGFPGGTDAQRTPRVARQVVTARAS
jgi:hypothetical protein